MAGCLKIICFLSTEHWCPESARRADKLPLIRNILGWPRQTLQDLSAAWTMPTPRLFSLRAEARSAAPFLYLHLHSRPQRAGSAKAPSACLLPASALTTEPSQEPLGGPEQSCPQTPGLPGSQTNTAPPPPSPLYLVTVMFVCPSLTQGCRAVHIHSPNSNQTQNFICSINAVFIYRFSTLSIHLC